MLKDMRINNCPLRTHCTIRLTLEGKEKVRDDASGTSVCSGQVVNSDHGAISYSSMQ